MELWKINIIPPLTSLTKILGIRIIHSKDFTPILVLNPPLQLEIILPHTVAPINIRISGIISFSNHWLIDIKLNMNWIYIGTTIQLYNTVPCIWHTSFQGLGVRNEVPPVSVNPNEGKIVQLLLVIKRKVSLPQTPPCKLYLRKKIHTETSGCCLYHTNESQATLLQLVTFLQRSKLAVWTYNMPLFIYPCLQNIDH